MCRMCLFPQVNSEEERLFDEKFSDIRQLCCISPIAILLDSIKICFKGVAIQKFYYFLNDKNMNPQFTAKLLFFVFSY